jgi:hypothetical protein
LATMSSGRTISIPSTEGMATNSKDDAKREMILSDCVVGHLPTH